MIILAASQATNGSRRSCLKNLLRLVVEEDIDVFTPLSFRRGQWHQPVSRLGISLGRIPAEAYFIPPGVV